MGERWNPWEQAGLKAITPLKKPRFKLLKVISFDTEAHRYKTAKGERQELAQFDFYDGTDHYSGTTKKELYSVLADLLVKYKKITVIAHNYNYDLRISGLLNHILLDKDILGLPVVTAFLSNIIYVRAETDNRKKRIDLLDSTNYFKFSLKKMAEAMGEKKTADEEYAYSPDEWNKYLDSTGTDLIRNDTEILYRYFTSFASRQDICLGVSLASTSFNTFRKNFLKQVLTIPLEKIPDSLSSYRGGRVEPYFLGREHVFIWDYDVNSLYPYVMKRFRYSTEFVREISSVNEDILSNIKNEARNYLFEVSYKYNEPVARLPLVIKDSEGRLVQAYESENKWITGRELSYLMDDGAEVCVHKGYEFRNDDIFSGFVDDFYAKKETATEPWRTSYKLVLNSLYGKFGQSKRKTFFVAVSDLPEDVRWIIERHPDKQRLRINGVVYSIYGSYVTNMELEGKAAYNPLIASEVTANARLHNYDIQKKIGFTNVIYTDSVAVGTPILIKRYGIPSVVPIENVRVGDFVISENGWTIVKDTISKFKKKRMFRVETYSGVVDVTDCHSLIDHKGNPVKPEELKKGDILGVPDYNIAPGNIHMDEEIAWMFGFFVADGSCVIGKHVNIIFSNQKLQFLEKCLIACRKIGLNGNIKDYPGNRLPSGPVYTLRIFNPCKSGALDLFRLFYNDKSKFIPSFVFNWDIPSIKAFLNGYMDGDGSDKNKENILKADDVPLVVYALHVLYKMTGQKSRYGCYTGQNGTKRYLSNIRLIRNETDKRLRPDTQIKKIEYLGEYDVELYDLETENHHFTAGGVLLHNTDSFFSTRIITDMVSSALGDLKEEHSGMAKIYDSKDYEIIEPDGTLIWKIKGISLSKIDDMYYEDGSQIFEMPVFKGFKNKNDIMDSVEVWNVKKKLSRLHSKLSYVMVDDGLLGYPRQVA